ncbi:hydrogenase formation protein HypD [bacterium]|nr:hydrogenase formation protein HypD [candidate division CSSED10-310 bacterium]
MKYLDEFRDPDRVATLVHALHARITRAWNIMEVCGGQTHAILRFGLDQLLPCGLRLIHGPGCPVCVTPVELVHKAILIASTPGVIFCTFGDMLRVPAGDRDLFSARAAGADVRVVGSPLAALDIAKANPADRVVFFGIGFETTAPATAITILRAEAEGIANFYLLTAHVLVPPAMTAVLAADGCLVHGFLAAGHVCTVTGCAEYEELARRFRVPVVVTGFEPVDLLAGIVSCVTMLENDEAGVCNRYGRAVRPEGNPVAIKTLHEVFTPVDRKWRGIGLIPASGLALRERFRRFDAEWLFGLTDCVIEESGACRSGEVLQGLIRPDECSSFGSACTPDHPLGATMVSSEGACAAYFKYRGEVCR